MTTGRARTAAQFEAVAEFDSALRAECCVLELAGGTRITLPVARWHASADAADRLLLDRCRGAALDVGCGPGRLAAALAARGVTVLGIDVSPLAVRLTRRRGAPALRRDVFDQIPHAGQWQHVVLADGNIGIGGDPLALLRRARELLTEDGTALVEVAAPGTGEVRAAARLTNSAGLADAQGRDVHRWFPWAVLDAAAVAGQASRAGFTVSWETTRSGRWFVELTPN